ncbi:MAG TPA: glycosyltransferase family 4 protein [Gemmataceae bacterium]|jgi:glycosyltransferase involved in cell wall biosynthesis|nr:glycosyltransferase family 4 protein [Gemmataceae bacterium]
MTRAWLLVSGDFTPLGGMDCANHALAKYLAVLAGARVHLVTHRAWEDLAGLPAVTVHRVWRPWDRHLAGMPLLARSGRRWARRLATEGARTVVNGGNCRWADVNWVHYVHAAYRPHAAGSALYRLKTRATHHYALAAERSALAGARLVVCNSERTRRDVVERLGVPEARAHVVYYGADASRFAPVTAAERGAARRALGWDDERPLVVFVGALGDRRKGFDTLFAAWEALCGERAWDGTLVVVGAGAELPTWEQRARALGLDERIRFLGFRRDVPAVLAACDVLVHPARYEAYGLGVQEALCRGLPALVSCSAGVAERYPSGLQGLLIPDPENAADLADRLRGWRRHLEQFRAAVTPLADRLRAHSWDKMAAQIVRLVETAA